MVGSAQAAAIQPPTEQTRAAATQTVQNLDAADAEEVKRAEFKAKLRKAIDDATPKPTTEAQADRVMKTGGAQASSALRGTLAAEQATAAGPLQSAAQTEVPASQQPAPPKTELQREPIGPPPAPVSAAAVVPAPLPPERLDYSSDRAPTDQVMADSGVSKEQLEKGNEPAFGETLAARSSAEEHEATAEASYRQSEAEVQDQAHTAAKTRLGTDLASIHGIRELHVGQVVGQQEGTSTKNALERQRITTTITGIKNAAQADVKKILSEMETEAGKIFETGLKRAEKAYEDTFEEAKGGVGTWLTTWGSDWDDLITSSLATAREAYMREVNVAIDEVADFVDSKLKAAKQRVADGRREVDTFVNGLEESVKTFGDDALKTVTADFEAMGTEIDERRDSLVDKLADQYKASYERMSATENRLREENKSLWQRVYDATVGVVLQILAFKDMLLSILAKAADVIVDIISDPIGFLGNLVSGVKLGLENFMANIETHLKKGLMTWIFGALGGAGLQLPETFDLQGIIGIVLQVLGITYANFRARAVEIVGEPVVGALEQAAEVFKVIVAEGAAGLWRFIGEQLADLKSMVLDAIFGFIKENVIFAGVSWIIGLLNPASAFFKACKAIYDIVMFVITRGSEIADFVNAVLDSMGAIAKGNIGVAAKLVEDALAKAIPIAIGFLASLLSLGDIGGTVRKTIEKAQKPVNKAIDWVINQALKLAKAAGKLIGGALGKRDTAHEDDPEKAAKIEAGLLALHTTETAEGEGGELTVDHAETVVKTVKQNHPVFHTLEATPTKQGGWEYEYSASERRKEPSPLRVRFDDDQIYRLVREIAAMRFSAAAKRAEVKTGSAGPSAAIEPGDTPTELPANIKARENLPAEQRPQGSTVEIGIGESIVFAKQGSVAANLIVAGLGKYPEITTKLERQGFDGPTIHAKVMEALRTGKGHKDIMRLTALIVGVEPARLELATVTGPMTIRELGQGGTPGAAFGREGDERIFGGGNDPVSMQRAARIGRRTDETLLDRKSFREGTLIHARTREFVQRVVEQVYEAVKGQRVRDTDQLRARIMELLERFDKEAGANL